MTYINNNHENIFLSHKNIETRIISQKYFVLFHNKMASTKKKRVEEEEMEDDGFDDEIDDNEDDESESDGDEEAMEEVNLVVKL